MLKFKDFSLAETSEDGGTVTGYASTWDREPDSYGDVVRKGAFANSLKRWEETGKPIPLLYGHNAEDPEYNIGAVTEAVEDERGLRITATFDADNPKAQYVRKLVKEGRVYQFSFAFEIRDQGEVELEDGRKANELRELELFEVSLVQIPANQHATVEDVKAAQVAEPDPEVKEGRRHSKADMDSLGEIRKLAAEIVDAIDRLTAEEDVDEEQEEQEAPEDGDPTEQAQGEAGADHEDVQKALALAQYKLQAAEEWC